VKVHVAVMEVDWTLSYFNGLCCLMLGMLSMVVVKGLLSVVVVKAECG
jgi:hypothetical protein